MDRWSTKDNHEREEEEAERLVRPAPKVKPPRHDKRREDTQPDRDPDVAGDPDLKGDPDMSLNYKNVGGSAHVVLARFLCADEPLDKVKVRKKDTGTIVYVTKETLRERGGEYEATDDEDEKPAAEPKPEAYDLAAARQHLLGLATDTRVKGIFQQLLNPTTTLGGLSEKIPAKSLGIPLPPGVTTIGDVRKILQQGGPQKAPKAEPPKAEPPKAEPPKAEPPKAESPKAESPKAESPPAEVEAKPESPKDMPPPPKDKPRAKKEKDEAYVEEEETVGPQKETVGPPRRRKVRKDEVEAARNALRGVGSVYSSLPARIVAAGTHPDDIRMIMAKYQAAKSVKIKPEDLEEHIQKSRDFYVTDPAKVPFPKSGKDSKGQFQTWEKLSPEDQANVYAEHQNEVVAVSLALQDQVTESLMHKSGVPRRLASRLASAMLMPKTGTPEEQEAQAQEESQKVYDSILSAGVHETLSDGDIQSLLGRVKDNPVARRMATAYFQACDYLDAREQFLGQSGPNQIDERDPPTVIVSKLSRAQKFLEQRQQRYPTEFRSESTDSVSLFRSRVMTMLQNLDPQKAAELEPVRREWEADEWDRKQSDYEKLLAAWRKQDAKYKRALVKAQAAYQRDLEKGGYRDKPLLSAEERLEKQGVRLGARPEEPPPKPLGYDEVRTSLPGLRAQGRALWNRMWRRKAASTTRVAARFLFSTCAERKTMGTPSAKNASDRTAVYWGVDPYPTGKAPGAYLRWEQAHARDLTEVDFGGILKAARGWMRSPVLSTAIEGIVPDTQYRAALDLALRDHENGKYSAGLHPALYNQLLARLAGESETETLLTVREASSGSLYAQVTGEDHPMRASSIIRKYASDIATSHPGVAFDLTDLALKLAEDEEQAPAQAEQKQAGEIPEAFKEHMKEKKEDGDKGQEEGQKQASYRTLKAAVIRAAQANPAARQTFLPLLQTIKKLG